MAPQGIAPTISAQHSLVLETRAPSANTPQAVLAANLASDKNLQQVETQRVALSDGADSPRGDRPRRRRRPSTPATSEPGLQQVETVMAAAPMVAEESQAAPHPTRRRQRPASPVVNEPLIQVETGQQP